MYDPRSNSKTDPFQFGANPFAALMNGAGAGGMQLPRFDVMGGALMSQAMNPAAMMNPAAFAPGFDAMVKGMARWNLEVFGFMSRRAQAYVEIPSRLSQCRTPQDLFKEQNRFWTTTVEQYMDMSRRLTQVTTKMMASTPAGPAPRTPRKRDYINVPGIGEQQPSPSGRVERRVA